MLHGLKALRDTLQQDRELTTLNTSVAVVGPGEKFTLFDGDKVSQWLDKMGDVKSSKASRQEEKSDDADDDDDDEDASGEKQPAATTAPVAEGASTTETTAMDTDE